MQTESDWAARALGGMKGGAEFRHSPLRMGRTTTVSNSENGSGINWHNSVSKPRSNLTKSQSPFVVLRPQSYNHPRDESFPGTSSADRSLSPSSDFRSMRRGLQSRSRSDSREMLGEDRNLESYKPAFRTDWLIALKRELLLGVKAEAAVLRNDFALSVEALTSEFRDSFAKAKDDFNENIGNVVRIGTKQQHADLASARKEMQHVVSKGVADVRNDLCEALELDSRKDKPITTFGRRIVDVDLTPILTQMEQLTEKVNADVGQLSKDMKSNVEGDISKILSANAANKKELMEQLHHSRTDFRRGVETLKKVQAESSIEIGSIREAVDKIDIQPVVDLTSIEQSIAGIDLTPFEQRVEDAEERTRKDVALVLGSLEAQSAVTGNIEKAMEKLQSSCAPRRDVSKVIERLDILLKQSVANSETVNNIGKLHLTPVVDKLQALTEKSDALAQSVEQALSALNEESAIKESGDHEKVDLEPSKNPGKVEKRNHSSYSISCDETPRAATESGFSQSDVREEASNDDISDRLEVLTLMTKQSLDLLTRIDWEDVVAKVNLISGSCEMSQKVLSSLNVRALNDVPLTMKNMCTDINVRLRQQGSDMTTTTETVSSIQRLLNKVSASVENPRLDFSPILDAIAEIDLAAVHARIESFQEATTSSFDNVPTRGDLQGVFMAIAKCEQAKPPEKNPTLCAVKEVMSVVKKIDGKPSVDLQPVLQSTNEINLSLQKAVSNLRDGDLHPMADILGKLIKRPEVSLQPIEEALKTLQTGQVSSTAQVDKIYSKLSSQQGEASRKAAESIGTIRPTLMGSFEILGRLETDMRRVLPTIASIDSRPDVDLTPVLEAIEGLDLASVRGQAAASHAAISRQLDETSSAFQAKLRVVHDAVDNVDIVKVLEAVAEARKASREESAVAMKTLRQIEDKAETDLGPVVEVVEQVRLELRKHHSALVADVAGLDIPNLAQSVLRIDQKPPVDFAPLFGDLRKLDGLCSAILRHVVPPENRKREVMWSTPSGQW
eukprot:TRINITY_DN30892_c0_g2_i1.p1 TRINITY_DN30892_c0_g2~~TRINITY_DN30892_c0_g2_i1.p1  ORF type:complete len:1132 (+),score=219.30 TRINITY_DN30892_c0_g2_i1:358-3396(+)